MQKLLYLCTAIPRRGCLHVIGWGSRHIKRRLLTLCSDALKLRNFHICIQDLATVDVLRDIDYPSCAYWCWYILRICVCAHAYLNYVAREYIYIRRGLRVVGLIQRAMRRPKSMERQQSDSTLFLYAYS